MTPRRRLAALLLLVALLLGVSACGGSDDDADDESTEQADGPTTTEADGDDPAPAAPGDNPGKETPVGGLGTEENTVTFDGEAFSPKELEVDAGEIFTFVATEDAETAAVTFDGAVTYTITTGLQESFKLDTPGTYVVTEYFSETPMTITVAG